MIKYEIKRSGEAHPVPVVVFEEEAYGLAGTFLLAEARSFGAEILSAMDEVCVGGRSCSFFSGMVCVLSLDIGQQLPEAFALPRYIQIPQQRFQAGGSGIIRRGSGFGPAVMGVSVAPAAHDVGLLGGEEGQKTGQLPGLAHGADGLVGGAVHVPDQQVLLQKVCAHKQSMDAVADIRQLQRRQHPGFLRRQGW